MKMIPGLTLAVVLATGVMAQTPDSTPPPLPPLPSSAAPAPPAPVMPAPQAPAAMPPADTNPPAPAKKQSAKKKKKAAASTAKKSSTPAEPTAPLVANEPAVARQNNVNVRAKASMSGEVIGHLKAGETVTVLELVTLQHPKTDEPAKWAKITLPATAHAWINGTYLDANKAVKPAKLNIRSGPGENYNVIGLLHKGDVVKDLNTKGDWTEIEPPTGTYAFVAAHLLAHKAPEATPMPNPPLPPPPPPIPSPVAGQPPIAPPPNETPGAMPPAVSPQVPPPLPPEEEVPTGPRIVQREGIVRGTVSIQAPSYYQLESLDNGQIIDYLYTSSTNLVLSRYKGKTVLVTGEEGLDERWPNTPVVTIQKIQVVQ